MVSGLTRGGFLERLADLAVREGFTVRSMAVKQRAAGRPEADVEALLERDGMAWSLCTPAPLTDEDRRVEADRAEQVGVAVWFGVGEGGRIDRYDSDADRLRALIARVPWAFIHPVYEDEDRRWEGDDAREG